MDNASVVLLGLFCLALPAAFLIGIGYVIGRATGRRAVRETLPASIRPAAWSMASTAEAPADRWSGEAAPAVDPAAGDEASHIRWLLRELNGSGFGPLIGATAVAGVRARYRARLGALVNAGSVEIAAAPSLASAAAVAVVGTADTAKVGRTFAPGTTSVALRTPVADGEVPVPVPVPVPAMPPPWAAWDRAVVLLYLGAFLVVAAGLVYSSSNWAELGGWQKVGLLAAATVAFAGGGLALLPSGRLRPAAETFVGIGALLVPMNVIAVHNLVRDGATRPAVTTELGAILVAALYARFAYRPGGIVYRYAAPVAALLAVGALPPALGVHWGWGLALVALTAVGVPDAPRRLGGRRATRRFARPVVEVGLAVLPAATLGAVGAAILEAPDPVAPVALAAATLAVGRFALRRASVPLAWLWTVLVGATGAAGLIVAERPVADWSVAAVAMASVGLWLGERGPGLVRHRDVRGIIHAEAIVLFAAAPIAAAGDGRWLLVTLCWAAATVGTAAIARLRREPILLGLAGVLATIGYLSIERLAPDRVLDAPTILLLVPAPLALAGTACALGRRWRGPKGRAWTRPLWAVAGVEAVGVTLIGLAIAVAEADAPVGDRLSLAGIGVAFAGACFVGGRRLRLPVVLTGAAAWLELAVVAALLTVPIAGDRRLPFAVLANVGLAALVLWLPFRGDWATAARRAVAVFGLGGGGALAGMVGLSIAYLVDLDRPPTVTDHPDTGWWWPYLGSYSLLAAVAVAAGRRYRRPEAVWVATGGLAAVGLLGLRMAYAEVDLDVKRWPLVVLAIGAAVAAGALAWRGAHPFDAALRRGIVGLGGVFGGSALVVMGALTLGYAIDLDAPYVRAIHADAGWWWPYLAVYAALAVGGWVLGRRIQARELAPVVAGGAAVAAVLGLRMATTDLALWSYAALAVGSACYGLGMAERPAGRGAFDGAVRAWAPAVGVGVVGLALVGNLGLAVRGETDAWAQAAVYVLVCLGVFGAGLWERWPALTYGAAVAAGLAIVFAGAAVDAKPINAAYGFAALSWLLAGGALTLPVTGRWAGQRSVWERAAYAAGALPVLVGLRVEGAFDPQDPVYQRLVVAILSLAGVVATVGVVRRSATRVYVGSALGLLAGLMEIAVANPANVQAYTMPVAGYLLVVGWMRRHDADGRVYDALTGAGAAMLVIPSVAQSLGPDGYGWTLIAGGEALGFVFAGLLLARRTPVAVGVIGVTLVALRLAVDSVNALPSWAILALVGVALLAIGTGTLAARELVVQWLATMRQRWAHLR